MILHLVLAWILTKHAVIPFVQSDKVIVYLASYTHTKMQVLLLLGSV